MPENLKNVNVKLIVILVLVAAGAYATWKFMQGKADGLLDVKDVRVGGYNFLTVGVMSVLFILAGKYLTAKFPIPGATEAFHAV